MFQRLPLEKPQCFWEAYSGATSQQYICVVYVYVCLFIIIFHLHFLIIMFYPSDKFNYYYYYFRKYFIQCSQSVPLQIFYVLKQTDDKNLKGPLSHSSTLRDKIQNSHFCLILGFLNKCPPIYIYYYANLGAGGSKIYIRIFDVKSEQNSVLLRRRRRFQNKRAHLSQHTYPSF